MKKIAESRLQRFSRSENRVKALALRPTVAIVLPKEKLKLQRFRYIIGIQILPRLGPSWLAEVIYVLKVGT